MLPVTLTLGLINVSTVIGTIFASRLIDPELAPRAIDLAFRLYMLPQGIFSVAVATVLFPTLARLAARADLDGLRADARRGHSPDRLPADPRRRSSRPRSRSRSRVSSTSAARSRPTRRPVVAGALAAFSVGLVFNGWMLLLNRAFYGLQANWIPTFVALGNLALNVALFAAFYSLGVWGLPLATSLSNLAGAVVALRADAPARDRRRALVHCSRRCCGSSSPPTVADGSRGARLVGRSTRCSDARSARRSSPSALGLAAATGAYLLACRAARSARARLACSRSAGARHDAAIECPSSRKPANGLTTSGSWYRPPGAQILAVENVATESRRGRERSTGDRGLRARARHAVSSSGVGGARAPRANSSTAASSLHVTGAVGVFCCWST